MEEAGFRVRGRVQGVGYRWWVRARAVRLGLAGSVRNDDDGSVEVHLRGPVDAVLRMRQMLAEGPPMAEVETVEPIPFSGAAPDGEFTILR